MKVAIVVPHIFMHRDILPNVIFSPASLATQLANGLQLRGVDVTLCTPGPVDTVARNMTADLTLFESELAARGDTYIDLLKKHPLTFITLARQVQAELIAKVFNAANAGKFDVVHVYTNEEELGLAFASLCDRPIIFTHHDPFNFLVKYRSTMPKYADLPWLSMSYAQRKGMPNQTNWLANIYHGLDPTLLNPVGLPSNDYFAYIGRIIEPKGVHLAIQAVKRFNAQNNSKIPLRIAGKHYSGHSKDTYWRTKIEPNVDGEEIVYEGYVKDIKDKEQFIGNARAVLMPSLFDEPFGMVAIESLACGTPVVALDSGALPEIITESAAGVIAKKVFTNEGKLKLDATADNLAQALKTINQLKRADCRKVFEQRFTLERMCQEHIAAYKKATTV